MIFLSVSRSYLLSLIFLYSSSVLSNTYLISLQRFLILSSILHSNILYLFLWIYKCERQSDVIDAYACQKINELTKFILKNMCDAIWFICFQTYYSLHYRRTFNQKIFFISILYIIRDDVIFLKYFKQLKEMSTFDSIFASIFIFKCFIKL